MNRVWAWRAVGASAAVLAVAGLAASAILTPGLPPEGGDGISVQAAASVVLPVTHPRPIEAESAVDPSYTYVATLTGATKYSWQPGGPAAGTLPADNPFGTAQVLEIVGTPDSSGWLKVELPIRPNGSIGWIPSSAASLTETAYKVSVDLEAKTVTVTEDGAVVLTTSAAVGAPLTPTPPGNTYLWELIRPDDPNGAYGPYIFGLAWFSDAYSVFNGGDAQIGMHGQDEPWSIGHAVSHGCVRLPNNVITDLAGMLPLGTPVSIS